MKGGRIILNSSFFAIIFTRSFFYENPYDYFLLLCIKKSQKVKKSIFQMKELNRFIYIIYLTLTCDPF